MVYVCVCVCVCVYVYVCVCVCICVCVVVLCIVYMYTSTILANKCMCVCVCVYMCHLVQKTKTKAVQLIMSLQSKVIAEATKFLENTSVINVEGSEVQQLEHKLTVEFGLSPITEGNRFFKGDL